MELSELEENLNKSLETFTLAGHHHVGRKQGEELNEYDYDELCRQSFYVFTDFKDNIIKYLKDLEK